MQFHSTNLHRWIAALLLGFPWLVNAQESKPSSPDLSVTAQAAGKVTIEAIAETGYFDEQKRYVIDLLEQDYAYLAVRIETELSLIHI